MSIFRNFIFATVLVGIISRILKFFLLKKNKRDTAIFLTFFLTSLILMPFISLTVGFDIAISEYLVALIIWLLFDIMRRNIVKGKNQQ